MLASASELRGMPVRTVYFRLLLTTWTVRHEDPMQSIFEGHIRPSRPILRPRRATAGSLGVECEEFGRPDGDGVPSPGSNGAVWRASRHEPT
jgi:hypothetical protein